MKSKIPTALIKTTFLIKIFILSAPVILFCLETGIMPTQLPGSNSVSVFYEPITNSYTYSFYHNGNLHYDYTVLNDVTQKGGTFNVLNAYDEFEQAFLPSYGAEALVQFLVVFKKTPGIGIMELLIKI